MSQFFLGLDGGASSSKWCVINVFGEKICEGKSGPVDGHIYREESKVRLAKLLKEIRNTVPYEISAAHVGLTGSPESFEDQIELKDCFKEFLGVSRLTIENDVYLGYRTAFGDEFGLFLYAGTGSILVYRETNGKLNRIGGWGYLLGDEGAGYWIGREAIRETLRAMEEGRRSSLSDLIMEASGGDSWDKIKRFVYSTSRENIASLAKPVLQVAESGSEEAKQVVVRAGLELSGLIKRAQKVLDEDSYPIAFSGGIATDSSILKAVIEREVGQEVRILSGDTALTAALVAKSEI
ncbi:MAG: N-acetylglucosamine kinase [Candidatus Nanopelagicaceae bacterium]